MRHIEKARATPYCNTGLLLASGATAASQQDCRCNTRHALSSVYVLLRSCERPIESWRSPARSTSTPWHLQGKASECCSKEALVQNELISCCEQATGTCNLVFTWRAEWMLSLLATVGTQTRTGGTKAFGTGRSKEPKTPESRRRP